MADTEMRYEEEALHRILTEINQNITTYQERKEIIDAETEELYEMYRSGDTEVYNDLMTNLSIQEHINNSLKNNQNIVETPYFGRIDYMDKEEEQNHSFYIGKHGINKDNTHLLIIDWRAPVSTIYYDCNLGEGTYASVDDYEIPINLHLKRTLDIAGRKLLGFYDSAAVTDDALLIKYLSQNKDAILGDIITTIQKEQNQIIREKPFHNIIVQGVAGSGKTTVAIHRISYLLYNYNDRYKAKEFCILGSNKVLLNYITSGLPDLDVHDTKQMEMEAFFRILLDEDLLDEHYQPVTLEPTELCRYKATLPFMRKLDDYLEELEREVIPLHNVESDYGTLMSKEHIIETLRLHPQESIADKAEIFDDRLIKRLNLILRDETKECIKQQRKQFRKYYSSRLPKYSPLQIYLDFLYLCAQEHNWEYTQLADRIRKQHLDLYDLAALTLIKCRTTGIEQFYMLKQIFIDEGQDFGISVYYALKQAMPEARFTIMGDVSQNIHYETGLNDWEELKSELFSDDKSRFYTLSKSYRNTIEISTYASKILDAANFTKYPIDPIIRHGKEVSIHHTPGNGETAATAAAIASQAAKDEYETIAIITKDYAEAALAQELLAPYISADAAVDDDFQFTSGIQIVPINLVKGLEFDVVILWNADQNCYENTPGEAKRLYVAATRALHELYICHQGELAGLLDN